MTTADHKKQKRDDTQKFGWAERLGLANFVVLIFGGLWAGYVFINYEKPEREIAQQKREIELGKLKASPIAFETDISIWNNNGEDKEKPKALGVAFHYKITNTAGRRLAIARLFVHSLRFPMGETANELRQVAAIEIPTPSVDSSSGWQTLISKAYAVDDEKLENGLLVLSDKIKLPPIFGGAVTGGLETYETTYGTLTLVVRPGSQDQIGFVVDALIRFPDNSERWIKATQNTNLVPGNSSAPRIMSSPDAKITSE
jgi:hypothetical protein